MLAVTTRTTSLTSVPHSSFALRFSDLSEIETACREDEEQRAARTLDWIGERIGRRCAKWVEDIQKLGEKDASRTPWWDEVRRCAEGNHVPSRTETWNHPVAGTSCRHIFRNSAEELPVIMGVSTNAPNPLQAITALHARPLEFPSWVDPNILRCTLIIHPQDSVLSDEEYVLSFTYLHGIVLCRLELVLSSMLSRSNLACIAIFCLLHCLTHLHRQFQCLRWYPACHPSHLMIQRNLDPLDLMVMQNTPMLMLR